MAKVIVTLKIMPESPNSDLIEIGKKVEEEIEKFGGKVGKKEHEPIAFGLKAIKVYFTMDENIGSTEELEKNISKIKGVTSVNVEDVRRTIG